MRPLHPHHIHPSLSELDRQFLVGTPPPKKTIGNGNGGRPNHAKCICIASCLLAFLTMPPNHANADEPNFASHSNQDVLDFSATRRAKKKRPFPPGEPVPPPPLPPPGGRREGEDPRSQPSLLLVAHQLRGSDHLGTIDFATDEMPHLTKPFPTGPKKGLDAPNMIPSPSGLIALLLAGRHRRHRIAYGVRPNHGRFHHHFVRSPPGANDQSRDLS